MSFLAFVKNTTTSPRLQMLLEDGLGQLQITMVDVIRNLFVEEDVAPLFVGNPKPQFLCKRAIRMILSQRQKWLEEAKIINEPFALQKVICPQVTGKNYASKTITSLSEYVKVYEPVNGEGIGGLDLNCCWLDDDDLGDVISLAKKIMSANDRQRLGFILLEGTKINKNRQCILDMVDEYCKVVGIQRTLMSSYLDGGKEFFNSSEFRKRMNQIVWVPQMWLDGTGWQAIFNPPLSEQEVNMIKKTHMDAYSKMYLYAAVNDDSDSE